MGAEDQYYSPPQGHRQTYAHTQQSVQQYDQQYFQQYNQQYGQEYGQQHNPQQPAGSQFQSQLPPQAQAPHAFVDEKHSFEQSFRIDKPMYNDIWAGVLLLLVFAGFIAVSAISIHGYASTRSTNGSGIYDGSGNTFSVDTNTIILLIFSLAVSVVLSYAYVWMARLFPKQFIWVTGILNILWALGTAIYYLYRQYWSAGIVFVIFAALLIFCFWTWIPRIPFSALMLRTSVDVSKKFGHVYLVSLLGGLAATAFGAWYSITLVAIFVKYQPSPNNPACKVGGGGCSQGKVAGLIVFVTFAMYWISEWLKNTVHTIIAGVYGSWYFYANNYPRGATRGAAKRALTYSFGSVSFGSLVVAIVQFLRQLCSVARNQSAADGGVGGMMGWAIFCILGCFLSILDWALSFLNRYAFCHIALYGKAYIPAAKDTWKMIKDRGIDALLNECLIGPVLSFGAIFVGYACALLAYLWLQFTKPAYNDSGNYTAFIMAFAFLIGFQIANIFTTPLMSGIETIFVAAGWDPQVMMNEHPELYGEMIRVYPRVQQAIRA